MADEQEPADGGPRPETAVGGTMHIHKPKPLHGVRDFLSEISVIVVGVLIALALEQAVEAFNWSHKVAHAEERLRADLKDDSSYATQYEILRPCSEAYLNRMQADLVKHDAADMERLHEFGPPFQGNPWKVLAWESAVASQIGDHMATSRFQIYAEAFRGANLLREFNLRYRDEYATAMTGRFALPPDTKTVADQLAAVDRLRTYIRVGRLIAANDIIDPVRTHLGITPSPAVVADLRQTAAKCLALLGPPSK
ncbi:MAG TPA: hypothetical protein VIC25_11440 [Caulobacteraceae bacterium]